MKPNKIINQEDQIILTKGSSNSTNVSTNRLTNTSTFVQGLFIQYLHKAVISIMCLHHLYKDISTAVYLLSSLKISLQVSLHKVIAWMNYFFVVHVIGSLNLVFKKTRITAKQAVVRGNLLKTSMHTRSHDTTYRIVN